MTTIPIGCNCNRDHAYEQAMVVAGLFYFLSCYYNWGISLPRPYYNWVVLSIGSVKDDFFFFFFLVPRMFDFGVTWGVVVLR